jgi:hypothetical protein
MLKNEAFFLGRCNSNCPHESASAFSHVLATARLVDMATAIGNTADVAHYTDRLALLKAAYHQRFYRASEGKYDEDGTASWIQSHQVFVSTPNNQHTNQQPTQQLTCFYSANIWLCCHLARSVAAPCNSV